MFQPMIDWFHSLFPVKLSTGFPISRCAIDISQLPGRFLQTGNRCAKPESQGVQP